MPPVSPQRIAALEAERADLLAQLAAAEHRAHQAAQLMYRRGYLAGHSAARRNAKTVRGPYRKAAA